MTKKNELAARVKELEQKENELINALRNTNQLEFLAMEDLKKVLHGNGLEGSTDSQSFKEIPKKSKK